MLTGSFCAALASGQQRTAIATAYPGQVGNPFSLRFAALFGCERKVYFNGLCYRHTHTQTHIHKAVLSLRNRMQLRMHSFVAFLSILSRAYNDCGYVLCAQGGTNFSLMKCHQTCNEIPGRIRDKCVTKYQFLLNG